ncbi:MAG: succinate dehydrogenase assembly factor 2 [Methylococcaceae bacterium]|nr:succinate dehydrogenase assembly factor 2 [Methylococcaceae bacterium]
MQSLAKLNWQCRRGMQELDRLLLHYLNTNYLLADRDEQQLFEYLLTLEDNDLIHFLLGNQLPKEPQLAELIKTIRTATTV